MALCEALVQQQLIMVFMYMGKKHVLKKSTYEKFSMKEIKSPCSKIQMDLSFDSNGQKFLEGKECNSLFMKYQIKLSNLTSILRPNRSNFSKELIELIKTLENLDKEKKLESLWEYGLKFSNISSMLNGAGSNASEAFQKLINALDKLYESGKLEELKAHGIISNMSSGAGSNATYHQLNREIISELIKREQKDDKLQRFNLEARFKSLLSFLSKNAGQVVEVDNNIDNFREDESNNYNLQPINKKSKTQSISIALSKRQKDSKTVICHSSEKDNDISEKVDYNTRSKRKESDDMNLEPSNKKARSTEKGLQQKHSASTSLQQDNTEIKDELQKYLNKSIECELTDEEVAKVCEYAKSLTAKEFLSIIGLPESWDIQHT